MKSAASVGILPHSEDADVGGFLVIIQMLDRSLGGDVWTEGKLVKAETEFLVIATSQYIDDEPAEEKVGDYIAIPCGTVVRVSRL